MNGEADLATIGSLLADRTRATFLLTLLSGGLTSASALASRAEVSPSLASNHLRKLTDGGLIVAEKRGRQRMFRLASQSIADALEALIPLAPKSEVRTLRGAQERDSLRRARLCYDHLAGRAGVALTQGLFDAGLLVEHEDAKHEDAKHEHAKHEHEHAYSVTDAGARSFADLGIDIDELARRPRPLTRSCLDWSEQAPHLAGSLGAALTAELLRRNWLESREASRIVTVTEHGRAQLTARFGIAPASLELPTQWSRAA